MNTQIPPQEPAPAAPPSEMIPKKPVIALRDIALLYGVLSAGVFVFLLLFSLLIWYITIQVGHAWDFGKLLMLFDLPLFLSYIAASSWYVFRFLWRRGKLHMVELEHDTHARGRAIEAEVRVKEREPMLLRGDQIGNYPAYVNPHTRQVLRLAPGNSIVRQAKEDQIITELGMEGEQDLAKVVDYWAIAHRVPYGHALLGVDPKTGDVITCDFSYLLTTWIVGGSGRGKTNTVALKVYEAFPVGRVAVYGQAFDDMKVLQMPVFSTERMPRALQALLPTPALQQASREQEEPEEEALHTENSERAPAEKEPERQLFVVKNTDMVRPGGNTRETSQEALSDTFQESEAETLPLLKKNMRDIGKQCGNGNRILDIDPEVLRWTRKKFRAVTIAGDERVTILKRWGVTPGRAYQEIGTAIDLLLEEQRTGVPMLVTLTDAQRA